MIRSTLRGCVLAATCASCVFPGATSDNHKQVDAEHCKQLARTIVDKLAGQPVWFRGTHEKFCSGSHAFPENVYDRADAPSPPNLAKLTIKDVRAMPVADHMACDAEPYISIMTDATPPLFITAKVGFEFEKTSHDITRETMFSADGVMTCFFGTDPVPAGTSDEDLALVRDYKVRVGMTKELAILALGEPLKSKVRTTAAGDSEEVTFNHHVVVTFTNGVVAEIEK